jgi:hypothetical protein
VVEMGFPSGFRTWSREGNVTVETDATPVDPGVDTLVDRIFFRGFQVKNSKQGRGSFFVADSVQNGRSFSVMFFPKPETRSGFCRTKQTQAGKKMGFQAKYNALNRHYSKRTARLKSGRPSRGLNLPDSVSHTL